MTKAAVPPELAERFNAWAECLVDMTGRNPLLNCRDTRKGQIHLTEDAARQLLAGGTHPIGDLVDIDAEDVRNQVTTVLRRALESRSHYGLDTLCLSEGLISWQDTTVATIRAPLILHQVRVELTTAAVSDAVISVPEDRDRFNPVLRHYLCTVGCELTDDEVEFLEEKEPGCVLAWLQPRVNAELQLGLEGDYRLRTFSPQKLPMVHDLRTAQVELARHPVVRALAGDTAAKAELQHVETPVLRNAPDIMPAAEETLILDADSSQQWAINAALTGQHLVIEGPPGTGKSQTIANLIAASMAKGERVLFVAEKQTAIEAVRRRIAAVGLGDLLLDLHDGDAIRSVPAKPFLDVLETLPDVQAVPPDASARALDTTKAALLVHRRRITTRQAPWGCSYQQLINLEAQLKVAAEADVLPLNLLHDETRLSLAGIDTIAQAVDELGLIEPIQQLLSPQWILQPALLAGQLNDQAQVQRFGDAVDLFTETLQRIAAVQTDLVPLLRHPETLGLARLEALTTAKAELEEVNQWVDVGALQAIDPGRREQIIRQLEQKGCSCDGLGRLLDRPHREAVKQAWRLLRPGIDHSAVNVQQVLRAHALLQSLAEETTMVAEFKLPGTLAEQFSVLKAQLQAFEHLRIAIPDADAPLSALLELDRTLAAAKPLAIHHAAAIGSQLAIIVQAGARKDGIAQHVISGLQQGATAQVINAAIRKGWIHGVREAFMGLDGALGSTGRRQLDELVRSFQDLDRHIIARQPRKIRRLVAERAHRYRLNHRHEEDLLRQQALLMRRRRGRLTTRGLFRKAHGLMLALKPCWAMTPLSVSQVIPPDRPYFDRVIFDEASQILPCDVVTVVLRAKQVVVVGDSKQLPPTTFFTRHDHEGDEDEYGSDEDDNNLDTVNALQETESLLHGMKVLLPLRTGTRTLQWHYRSRDERLVAFANRHPELYGKQLLTVPAATDGEPFRFHMVKGELKDLCGVSPKAEVEAAVELCIQHLQHKPEQSLAVVAFGQRHADRIQTAFDRRLSTHPVGLPPHPPGRPGEPFKVCHPEGVQGDERDVIVIATGYGRDALTGEPSYRIGPLGQDQPNMMGLRRLNVAITRAREQVQVVTTIDPELYSAGKLDGNTSFKAFIDYLRFVQSGGPHPPAHGRTSLYISGLEEDVYRALTERGLKLVPKMGASSNPVDFAVQHPHTPGRYVMAIEVDGADNGANDTLRDRDRLRQQVLKDRGWWFHRIWSTAWFDHRQQEIDLVVTVYEQCLAAADEQDAAASRPAATTTTTDATSDTPAPAPLSPPTSPSPNNNRQGALPIAPRGAINKYTMPDLIRVIAWYQSDGALRSDEQILRGILPCLGFSRRGNRVVTVLNEAIAVWRQRELGAPGSV